MTDKAEYDHCPVCDNAMLEITDDYHERLCALQEDLQAKLVAVAEAHARGEHENSHNLGTLSRCSDP